MQQNPARPRPPSTREQFSMQSDVNETGPTRDRSFTPLAVGLLGAAAIAAGVLFVRQQSRDVDSAPRAASATRTATATSPTAVSLERLRELGI